MTSQATKEAMIEKWMRRQTQGRQGQPRRQAPTGQPPAAASMDRRADYSSRPAATAMAEPAERRSPRAHRSYMPDQSAVLRDRLLKEIAALPSEDSATAWAQRALAGQKSAHRLRREAVGGCFRTANVRALAVRTLRVIRRQWVSGSIFV